MFVGLLSKGVVGSGPAGCLLFFTFHPGVSGGTGSEVDLIDRALESTVALLGKYQWSALLYEMVVETVTWAWPSVSDGMLD